MNTDLSPDIANAVDRQGHPLEVRDAKGRVFIVMTGGQFQRYIYDDSDIGEAEMLSATVSILATSNDWNDSDTDNAENSSHSSLV